VLAITGTEPGHAAIASPALSPTVRLAATNVGKILVDRAGYTLYMFTRDRPRQDRCAKMSGCARVWPALTTTRRVVPGTGVRAPLLGTIKLGGGVMQVTYAGHPLYSYSGDYGPRSTRYVGAYNYGGSWYAVAATGRPIRSGGL
jgi:predicted lipoprotein with Yx(FWY)xxD motif